MDKRKVNPRPRSPEIILVRHGETALNVGTEKIRGWQDVPLDAEGEKEAVKTGQVVAKLAPVAIFTSDLQRAAHTAEAVQQAMRERVPIARMQELRPWNVGQYTGQPVSEIKDELVRLLKAKNEPAPGGESYLDFAHRFLAGFLKITYFARKLGQPVVVVTHSRGTRTVKVLVESGVKGVLNAPPGDVLLKAEDPIPPGGFVVLRWNGTVWEWTNEKFDPGVKVSTDPAGS